MTFGDFNVNHDLEQFDFDSFLQDTTSIDFDPFQQGIDISNIKPFSFKDGAVIVRAI